MQDNELDNLILEAATSNQASQHPAVEGALSNLGEKIMYTEELVAVPVITGESSVGMTGLHKLMLATAASLIVLVAGFAYIATNGTDSSGLASQDEDDFVPVTTDDDEKTDEEKDGDVPVTTVGDDESVEGDTTVTTGESRSTASSATTGGSAVANPKQPLTKAEARSLGDPLAGSIMDGISFKLDYGDLAQDGVADVVILQSRGAVEVYEVVGGELQAGSTIQTDRAIDIEVTESGVLEIASYSSDDTIVVEGYEFASGSYTSVGTVKTLSFYQNPSEPIVNLDSLLTNNDQFVVGTSTASLTFTGVAGTSPTIERYGLDDGRSFADFTMIDPNGNEVNVGSLLEQDGLYTIDVTYLHPGEFAEGGRFLFSKTS